MAEFRQSPERAAADRADLPYYAVAAFVLVVGGALMKTWLLNWISGPVFVVVCVAGIGALADRRRQRRR